MSKFFEKDRALYISNLNNISLKGDWNSWIEYYLNGIIESANESTNKASKILNLYEYMKREVIPTLNSAHGISLLDFIFSTPIFNATQVQEKTDISIRTVYTLLNKLIKTDFITSDDAKRYKTYYCPQLLKLI